MRNIKTFVSICLITLLFVSNVAQATYKKVIHNTDPQAKCLDGSPSMLYISEGTVKDKFLIFFWGGGYCAGLTLSQTLQSCYQRSLTYLGSSKYWPDTVPKQAGGYLSDNEPLYANWTRIILPYCDGAFHQGVTKNQIKYKDSNLYFRGSLITKAHFKWLVDNYQMDQASTILLTGASAGGIAVAIWDGYLRSIIKDSSAVKSVPDSGLFAMTLTHGTNLPLLQITLETLVKLSNIDEKTPILQCNKAHPGDQWRCLFAEYNYPYLKGNFLWIGSQYDSYAISVNMMINCLKTGVSGESLFFCNVQQMKGIQKYRASVLSLMQKMKNQRNSFWYISCSTHVYAAFDDFYDVPAQRVPQFSIYSPKKAIQQFVFQGKNFWMVDDNQWPLNEPCAY